MSLFETAFEVKKQKIKLKDVIYTLCNYYNISLLNYSTNTTTYWYRSIWHGSIGPIQPMQNRLYNIRYWVFPKILYFLKLSDMNLMLIGILYVQKSTVSHSNLGLGKTRSIPYFQSY